jgi:hypothetical protein
MLDPTQSIDYDALDIPEARPPLDADPARWLQGAWTSKREQIRWEPGEAPRPSPCPGRQCPVSCAFHVSLSCTAFLACMHDVIMEECARTALPVYMHVTFAIEGWHADRWSIRQVVRAQMGG